MTHLSAVPSAPSGRRYTTHESIVRAIYEDKRVGRESRELLFAVAYGLYLTESGPGKDVLREARRVLGRNRIGRSLLDDLIRADLPRYEAPEETHWHAGEMTCEAPRLRPYRRQQAKPIEPDPTAPVPIRRYEVPPEIAAFADAIKQRAAASPPPRDWRTEDGVCGARSAHRVDELDPRTGWVTARWFCRRHSDHAGRVAGQVRAQNEAAPEPVPNTGGLLPAYFKADWEAVYRHYSPGWEPPRYGICADDWPEPGEAFKAHRRLRAVNGGGNDDEEA